MATHDFGEDGANGRPALGAQEWYRYLVERVPAVLYVDESNEASSAIYVSPQTDSMLGYSRGEWLEDPDLWVKILHPEDRKRVLAEHGWARQTGGPFEAEYRLIARDGSVVWVRDEAVQVDNDDGGPGRRAGVLLDITERKLYEGKLKKSEGRYRELFDNAMEGIARISSEGGTIEYCNPAYASVLGLTPEECSGRSFFEFVDGEDEVEARRQRELRLSDVGSEYEVTITAADGRGKLLLCGGYPLRGPDGTYEGAVQTITDITERRRYEEETRQSEELFRITFEAAAVGIAHVTPDGRWLRINDKLCEISGYPREELLGTNIRDLTPSKDLEEGQERVRRLLDGRIGPYTAERRYMRKDGSRVWVNLSVSLVRASSGEPEYLVCVTEDITARKVEGLGLTERETEVLRRIAIGRSNTQIAQDLSLSLGTVKLEIQHILEKLRVRDRGEAVARAVETGIFNAMGG